jgi:hypothetical protein
VSGSENATKKWSRKIVYGGKSGKCRRMKNEKEAGKRQKETIEERKLVGS